MATPILAMSGCCCGKIPINDLDKVSKGQQPPLLGNRLCCVTPIFDAFVALTCLVVGILGAISIIAIPAAAAYTLIGISGGIAALWIIMGIILKCNNGKGG